MRDRLRYAHVLLSVDRDVVMLLDDIGSSAFPFEDFAKPVAPSMIERGHS